MAMTLKCVTVDDEPLARECIADYVEKVDFLQLVGVSNNPVGLTQLLDEREVDLIFLDIQMPVISGIDFLKMARNPPLVVITTAHPRYALESFQLDVLDYLLKPITFSRFFKAVSKVREYHHLLHSPRADPSAADLPSVVDYFFVRCNNKYEKIYFDDILYVQALQNYVTIHTHHGKYVTLFYLKDVEKKLNQRRFIRVHKSYLVAIAKIEAIENYEIIIESSRIPISRSYREEVIERVVNQQLWRK